jgi:hypothetical protein
MRQIRLAELDAEAQDRRAARHEREIWERKQLRFAVRNLPQAAALAMPPTNEPDAPDDGPEPER